MLTRPFRLDDLPAVHQLVNAASKADQTSPITRDELRAISNPADETAVAALSSGEIAGFAWWDLSDLTSVAFDGWVHPDHRRKGVGTALLVAIEQRARDSAIKQLTGRVLSTTPGAQVLFRLRGFAETRRFDRRWTDLPDGLSMPAAPTGITLRLFRESDLVELVDADNDAFSTHWGSKPVTVEQFCKRMMQQPYYHPSLWALACDESQNGRIAAICLCRPCEFGGPHDGWVSHLGVRPAYRARSLGRLVLHYGLWNLQQADFTRAGLHVDSQNVPAIRLYESMGLHTTLQRIHFAKSLE